MNELAIVALTPRGLEIGQKLKTVLGRGEIIAAAGNARALLSEQFLAGKPLVCVMALGIVVRILGPLTQDKTTDPPVVVVDEAGRFAISVLGGHMGGSNDLANEVAAALEAIAVITTASDVLGLPALDLVGRDWGWKIEDREHLTQLSAAVVRGEWIGVYQETGRTDWWCKFGDWPANFQRIKCWPQKAWGGLIIISDRWQPDAPYPTVVYRPPSLVLGVGCRRGVSCEEIESLFQYLCQTRGYSPLSLGLVATAEIKADEPGLCEFATMHEVPLRSFSLKELGEVRDLPTPSERVREKIGIAGVAEPAALLASGAGCLLEPKYPGKRVRMALARREDA